MVTGAEEDVSQREEASSEGAVVDAERPSRHCDGRLVEGARNAEGLDKTVVCTQAWTAYAVQERQAEGDCCIALWDSRRSFVSVHCGMVCERRFIGLHCIALWDDG